MRRTQNILALVAAGLVAGTAASQAQLTERVGITNQTWSYLADNSDQYAAGFPSVDDSTWPTGRGLFGNDTGYPYPMVTTVAGSSGGVQTSYYRTRFNWVGGTSGVIMTMTNYIDDGIAIYLNGTELGRWNIAAAGLLTHGQQAAAANPGGEPVRVVHQFNLDSLTNGAANPLLAGENVLAVSVHQAGTGSSDSVFGMAVHSSQIVAPCQVAVLPATTNAFQCRNVTLSFTLPADCGIPAPTIQWYRTVNGGAEEMLVGRTGTSLTVSNLVAGDSGQYYVRLSNAGGTVESVRATLNVQPDTQGPQVVSVVGVFGQDNQFLVTFDEAPLPFASGGTADDTFTWSIESTDGVLFTTQGATLVANNPNQVLLTTDGNRVAGKTYRWSTVEAIADLCAGVATPAGLTGNVLLQDAIIDYADNKIWRYDDTAVDRGAGWTAPAYDDSAWKTGQQLFDRSRGNLARTDVGGRTVRTFLELTNFAALPPTNVPSFYLRLKTTIPAGTTSLTGYAAYDDGFIMYVNGVEVYRVNVNAGAENFAAYGGAGAINATDAGRDGTVPFNIPMSNINVGGENTIAVLLKQNDSTSSDITFGLRVIATAPSFAVDPIVITQQPVAVAVTEGHTLSLSVTATGSSPTYQWFRNGTEIAGATSATYTKLAVPGDQGNYYVVVSNPAGPVQSSTVSVTVRPVVLSYGATWRYETNAMDATLTPGNTPWYAQSFDDSLWQSGAGPFARETTAATLARFPAPVATQLPAPSATFLTAYFRSTVTAPTLSAGQQLVLTHLVDDGAAVYVDGQLVYRYNLTNDAPIASSALAPAAAPGDGDAARVSVPITLTPGQHLIAVEVHQNSATSSDVVFGAELRILSGSAPALTITNPTATTVQVTWAANPLYSLYSAATVDGTFTPVAGNPQGTYSAPSTTGNQFFQLRFNGQ